MLVKTTEHALQYIGFWIENLQTIYRPAKNGRAEVPTECDEAEHPPLYKYYASLPQGKSPSRHVPEAM